MNRLETVIRNDPELMRLLECLRGIAPPQWRVVSGCLYQTVWNVLHDLPRGTGIQDIDVIWFDDSDLSWEAEDRVIRRVAAEVEPIGVAAPLQVRNQARVHLWYDRHFGTPYAPLRSADEALERYPVIVQAIGARLEPDGTIDIIAPFGLDDVFGMIMRPNPAAPHGATFDAKVARARSIWPRVRVA